MQEAIKPQQDRKAEVNKDLMEGKKLGKSNRSICALYVFEKLNRRWKTKRK